MRIVLSQTNPIVGNCTHNAKKIKASLAHARQNRADLVVFPEMALLGYPPGDLLLQNDLCDEVEKHLTELIAHTSGIACAIGCVRKGQKMLYNSAAVIANGCLLGFYDKRLLPTYDVFDERRYFESGSTSPVFEIAGKKIAFLICEDMWRHSYPLPYDTDPVAELQQLHPDLLVNLSASPYHRGHIACRQAVAVHAQKTLNCPVVLCNQAGAQDSLIFDGHSLYIDLKAKVSSAKGFCEEDFYIDTDAPPPPAGPSFEDKNLLDALTIGICDYFQKLSFQKALVGLSGGIDSAVVAAIAVRALGAKNVIGLAMPSRYSSDHSLSDAQALAHNAGIEFLTQSIEEPLCAFEKTLKPSGLCFENLQSRIRGTILMTKACEMGALVLATGNKCELAMGYCTLYGDTVGCLAPLGDCVKGDVYMLARLINEERVVIPQSSIDKEPSAELAPNQKDSDSLPPYPILDDIVRLFIEEGMSARAIAKKLSQPLEYVGRILCTIEANEFKRQQCPPILRVTKKSLRCGRLMPIVK